MIVVEIPDSIDDLEVSLLSIEEEEFFHLINLDGLILDLSHIELSDEETEAVDDEEGYGTDSTSTNTDDGWQTPDDESEVSDGSMSPGYDADVSEEDNDPYQQIDTLIDLMVEAIHAAEHVADIGTIGWCQKTNAGSDNRSH